MHRYAARVRALRLFLMPFCVSSFAALVKDAGYVLVFPPSLADNLIGLGAIGSFLVAKRLLHIFVGNSQRERT